MKKRARVGAIVVCLALLLCCCTGVITAFAFNGYSSWENSEDLFSATNTYNCVKYDKENSIIEYDMSNKRQNVQVMDSPQITVLTHGWGCNAGTWSNQYSKDNKDATFAYDEDSLIWQLQQRCDANVYWAKMSKDAKFNLYNITNERGIIGSEGNENLLLKEDYITDISKHIILVFEANESNEANNKVYFEFNTMLSKVISDVTVLNGGILPKVNLVAHSRGGITNLQYALDHPDLVDSLISMGTPYFGSTTATLYSLIKTDDGLKDILNKELFTSYANRWNNNYESLYKNINAVAIGAYSSIDFLIKSLNNDNSGMLSESEINAIGMLLHIIESQRATSKIFTPIGAAIEELVGYVLHDKYSDSVIASIVSILFDEISFDWKKPHFSWRNDICVDLNSQQAIGIPHKLESYKGFKRKTRYFTDTDIDFTKVAVNKPPVPHNLEPRDDQIIHWVINELDLGHGRNTGFKYYEKDDGTVALYDFIGGGDGRIKSFNIPASFDGKPLTEISDYAFEGVLDEMGVEEVIIPASVTSIGSCAFADNALLTTLTLSNGGMLERIGSSAFANCTALQSFELPATLNYLEEAAFYNCKAFNTYTVNSANERFTTLNGVLYEKENGVKTSLIAYPIGKTDITFNVPSTVTTIREFAFAECDYPVIITLNNVSDIRPYAFINGNVAEFKNADKVVTLGTNAFEGTEWLNIALSESEDDYVSLGNVLCYYKGNETDLILDTYMNIGTGAFLGNESVRNITLTGDTSGISDYAFASCGNLQSITIKNTDRLVYAGNSVLFGSDNVTVYVPEICVNDYKNNVFWSEYRDNIQPITTTVIYDSDGGSNVENGVAYYGSPLEIQPVPQKKDYEFVGWKYNNGSEIVTAKTGDIWLLDSATVTFTAVWREKPYSVNLYLNGGTGVELNYSYTVSSGFVLPIPQKAGYAFAGWYENEDLDGDSVSSIAVGETGFKTYYAKWTPNVYNVTLDCNYENCPPYQVKEITYGEEYTLPVPEREGYYFNGWRVDNDKLCTGENGISNFKWDIAEDTMLKADWTRKQFAIQVNRIDNSIVWMTDSGFSDDKVFIPYGTKFLSLSELIIAFNPDKISLKEGYEFDGFYLNGEKLVLWDTLPDLGENEYVLEIEARYVKETDFEILYYGFVIDETNPLRANYGDEITLMSVTKVGYEHVGWRVCDNEYNQEHYSETPYAPGTIFNFSNMPDLSYGVEGSRYTIYVEPVFIGKTYQVTLLNDTGSVYTVVTVSYGTYAKLPVATKTGYTFNGWTFADGTFCTNSNGRTLVSWDKDYDVEVTANFVLTYYTIHFFPYVGSYLGATCTPYTIESEFDFAPYNRGGYRFRGWYTSTTFAANTKLTRVVKGTTGDIYLYAAYDWLYCISYVIDGSTIYKQLAIAGEKIEIYKYDIEGYTIVWNGYHAGDSYTVLGETIFTKSGQDAHIFEINLYSSATDTNPYRTATVTYGQSYTLPIYSPSDTYKFLGWYDKNGHNSSNPLPLQEKFTDEKGRSLSVWLYDNPVDLICENIPKTNSLAQVNFSGEHIITDDGRFKQHYDTINIKDECGYSVSELYELGYRQFTVSITIQIKQKDHGYQYVFLYLGVGENDELVSSVQYDGTFNWVTYYPTFTYNIRNNMGDTLCIRYGASGSLNDDWYRGSVDVTVTAKM